MRRDEKAAHATQFQPNSAAQRDFKMFKKVFVVLASLFVLTSTVMADDDLLSELASNKGANIVDSQVEVEEIGLDLDVDQLAENAEGEEDAVEACFRRFGYRSFGWGYRYARPYYSCYSRCYNHFYTPVYNYCRPAISYWGCY